MNQLLVPLDFSTTSINALEHAIGLANMYKFNIRLLHVKRKKADYDATFNFRDFDEVVRSGVVDNFEKIVAEYKPLLKGSFDYRIRDGRIYSEICNQAKYGDNELIVMGTQGVSGFEERWAGSNAARVVTHATCPVITVKYNFPPRKISRIILPLDHSVITRKKVPFLTDMAKRNNAKIFILEIRENNKASTKKTLKEYSDQVVSYLKRKGIQCSVESQKTSHKVDSIIEYALLNDADIIGVMTDTEESQRHKLLGADAQHIVNHSPIPVISFKP